MARRRHYRGLVRFPGLGRLSMPSSVKPVHVAVGLGLGLAGSVGLQKLASAAIGAGVPVPGILASGSPLVGGLTTAAALYFAQKKKNPLRAAGTAIGAALSGLAVYGWGMISSAVPMSRYGAPIFQNPRMQGYGANRILPQGMGGPIFNNPQANLSRLAQMQGLGDDNEDGNFPAP
jgi:hypothetical protein